jgi:Co/Zn/Cd efflux system component
MIVAVAAIGIFVNGGTALLFSSGAGDFNVKSAFFHLRPMHSSPPGSQPPVS